MGKLACSLNQARTRTDTLPMSSFLSKSLKLLTSLTARQTDGQPACSCLTMLPVIRNMLTTHSLLATYPKTQTRAGLGSRTALKCETDGTMSCIQMAVSNGLSNCSISQVITQPIQAGSRGCARSSRSAALCHLAFFVLSAQASSAPRTQKLHAAAIGCSSISPILCSRSWHFQSLWRAKATSVITTQSITVS